MPEGRWRRAAFPLLFTAAYVLFAGLTARRFPPVSPDEVLIAAHGDSLWRGQGNRYAAYDDIFARDIYALRDIFPDVARPVYTAFAGVFQVFFGSPAGARLSSVAAGAALLFLLYGMMAGLGAGTAARAALFLTASSAVFLAASCVVRNETLSAALVAGALFAASRPGARGFLPLAAGACLGLSLGVHPNVLCAVPGVVFILFHPREHRRGAVVGGFAAGFLGGALLTLALLDPARTALSIRVSMSNAFVVPPFMQWPWKPWEWLSGLGEILYAGHSYYFPMDGYGPWRWARAVSFLTVMGLLSAAAATRARAEAWEKPWAAASGLTVAAFLFLVNRREFLYGVLFLPFLVPLAAAGYARCHPWVRRGVGAVLISCAAGFVMYAGQVARFTPSLSSLSEEVRRRAGGGFPKLVGPNLLWPAWPRDKFRDAGALMYSRWYSDGKVDLAGWMGPWRPEILVLDPAVAKVLFQGDPGAALPGMFPGTVEDLGALDGSAYGTWRMFRLHWRE